MVEAMSGVGVVVPVLNARAFLPSCLDALLAAAARRPAGVTIRVVVVDNGSTDGSAELVARDYPDVHLERLPGVTVSALRNAGARIAGGDVLAFIDADCVVAPDYFERALEVLAQPAVDATGCAYALPDRAHWIERAWHAMHQPVTDGPVNYINSGNLVCRRGAFDAIGGFAPELVTGEDTEFCQRLWQSGYRIHQSRSVEAVHLGNPKSLRAFVRKQAWHARGMFGTFRNEPWDKPVILTVAHLLALASIPIILALFGADARTLLVCLGLLLAAPALAVAYRIVSNRRLGRPAQGIVLYFLYLTTRAGVLLSLLAPRRARVPAR